MQGFRWKLVTIGNYTFGTAGGMGISTGEGWGDTVDTCVGTEDGRGSTIDHDFGCNFNDAGECIGYGNKFCDGISDGCGYGTGNGDGGGTSKGNGGEVR